MATNLLRFLLFAFIFAISCKGAQSVSYEIDNSDKLALHVQTKNSHLKVYMPSLPYFNIISLVNGTLVRLSNTKTGWEYFLAKSHKKVDELTYDFELRDDVRFQDGSIFNAQSVVENIKHFKKGPFLYSDIHNSLKDAVKLSEFKVRIRLKKPYGMLLNDLCVVNFYTKEYYKHYDYEPSLTAQNTKGAGAYGAGPYMITKGYADGLKQSDVIVLEKNPYYFEKNKPFVEKITIYTKMPIDKVIENISKKEGLLDIAVIPFDKKTEIVNSKYAKLVKRPSNSNFTIHFNLIKKNSPLKNQKIRQALNDAINQENLIKFTFKNEAVKSPFLISSNAYYAKQISKEHMHVKPRFSKSELKKLLNGLHLKVLTQDRFLFVWRGIEYELSKYGVSLEYDITTNEKYVLKRLFMLKQNNYDWDLLIWGNDDWNGHPWTGLFTLYTGANWTSLDEDKYLYDEYQKLFKLDISDKNFQKQVNNILLYIYDKAYTLVLPSPNMLFALNKEVIFKPSGMATFPLWDAKITPFHWSIRGDKALPKQRLEYFYPKEYK